MAGTEPEPEEVTNEGIAGSGNPPSAGGRQTESLADSYRCDIMTLSNMASVVLETWDEGLSRT